MNTATKVGGFLAALGALFGVAVGVGQLVGPTPEPASDVAAHGGHDDGTSEAASSSEDVPGGLMISQNGYTLSLGDNQVEPGRDVGVSFTINGPTGKPVTEYDVEHEKRLHLIAVRRDFTGFQHVHPELGSDGVWSAKLDLTSGQWRLFADFKAADADALTLGADLAVGGDYRPEPPGGESRTAQVDGYTVKLDGDLTAGKDAKLTLDVSRDGKPVTDLQPYLGAYGHLVALRSGDLAYLHVHPDGTPGDGKTQPGPQVVFYAAVPSAGTYHLYLDFQHDGVVRTASFAVSAGEAEENHEEVPEENHEEEGDGHGH